MRLAFNLWRHVSNERAGGAEAYEHRVLSRLAARGHDVSVVVGGDVSGPSPYRVIPNGGVYSQYLRAPLTRARHLEAKPDVIIDGINGMPFFSPLSTRVPTVGFVHHVHVDQWSDYFPAPVARTGRFLESRGVPWAYRHSMLIAVSPSTASDLVDLGICADQIRVIPAGYEPAPAVATESPEPLFLALGRLVPNKRLDLLVDIWQNVYPHVGGRLVIAGDGPLRAALAARNVPGVELPGFVSDAERDKLLESCWFLVHAAKHEGWGLVVSEAAARGRPSLAFDVPGVRDAIAHGRSGLLVNSFEEYAKEWIDLAGDQQRRTELGSGALDRAQHYSWDHVADAWESALDLVVPKSPLGAYRAVRGTRGAERSVNRQTSPVSPRTAPARSIVIPAYNEEARLPELLLHLPQFLDLDETELIVVDDGSSDRTAQVAAEAGRTTPRLRVIRLPHNRGKGAAVRAGVAAARGPIITFLDADNASDLAALDQMEAALEDFGAIFASRVSPGSSVTGAPWYRSKMGGVFHGLAGRVSGSDITDTQCGFKLFRAPLAKAVFRLSTLDGFAFDVEVLRLLMLAGVDVCEFPIDWTHRPGSKIGMFEPIRMSFDLARIGATKPQGHIPSLFLPGHHGPVDVRAGDALFENERGTRILLPFTDHAGQQALAERLMGDARPVTELVSATGVLELFRTAHAASR